jgi:hypothetical protein
MAAKFFTGLPLDGPDPECVRGHGEPLVAAVAPGSAPKPDVDHSVPVLLSRKHRPDRACDESPLAGLVRS